MKVPNLKWVSIVGVTYDGNMSILQNQILEALLRQLYMTGGVTALVR